MKTIQEPGREIPVACEADVVVCGGGPAGVGAALAVKNGVEARNADAASLRQELQKQGVIL
ncbi:MAG: hypothetical protein R6V03_06595 [Kiritimatiellia bacterium]